MAFLIEAALVALLGCLVLVVRLCVVVKTGSNHKPGTKGSVAVLVVIGSGGHTSEMLRLMECMSAAYTPRYYVIADTDKMSEEKILTFENSKQLSGSDRSQFNVYRIPRSREVHQSWSSTVLSTLRALQHSFLLVLRIRPDVVLCNGPGTCVPLCLAGVLLGILGIKKVLIVYIESICRVHSLSLTGKILYPISDYFFVQWSSLKDRYTKAIFLGRVV